MIEKRLPQETMKQFKARQAKERNLPRDVVNDLVDDAMNTYVHQIYADPTGTWIIISRNEYEMTCNEICIGCECSENLGQVAHNVSLLEVAYYLNQYEYDQRINRYMWEEEV